MANQRIYPLITPKSQPESIEEYVEEHLDYKVPVSEQHVRLSFRTKDTPQSVLLLLSKLFELLDESGDVYITSYNMDRY